MTALRTAARILLLCTLLALAGCGSLLRNPVPVDLMATASIPGMPNVRPDRNRRVVLLSPPDLPDAVRTAETFVLGVPGTGLQRVRIKAWRDARGGWITIVDASGKTLRETPDGYVVKRRTGARDVPIERLRFEFDFRTTNPRPLQNIVIR